MYLCKRAKIGWKNKHQIMITSRKEDCCSAEWSKEALYIL